MLVNFSFMVLSFRPIGWCGVRIHHGAVVELQAEVTLYDPGPVERVGFSRVTD